MSKLELSVAERATHDCSFDTMAQSRTVLHSSLSYYHTMRRIY